MKIVFRCDPALIDWVPRPVPAREALPEWLKTMPATMFSDLHGQEIRTVKQCPPFVDGMAHGFLMTLPCDVTVAGGRFTWDWKLPTLAEGMHPRSPLSFHVPAQVEGSPLRTNDRTLIKFNSFWTIELEPGYSLYATHPANRDDLPFRSLTGLVDSDRYNTVGILFPAIWTNPDFEGTLPAGTPVAQCFPVAREDLKLEFAPFTEDKTAAYDETAKELLGERGLYRKVYRDRRSRERRPSSSK